MPSVISRNLNHIALLGLCLALLSLPALLAGCAGEEAVLTTSTAVVEEPVPHTRSAIDFYRGLTEPQPTDWDYLPTEAERLLLDGFNIVTLEPPVLITERAGGQPRMILEGMALKVPDLAESIHTRGLAVFLAPTTASPGLQERITADETTLERLREEALEWSIIAEETQVELFAPLSRCNLALGTEACRAWLQEVLPGVREHYQGPLAAKVVADLNAPVPGVQHAFELLDYRGYDYLVIEIRPWGHIYQEERFRAYVTEVLDRAETIVARDGLQGVIIGDLRLPRNSVDGALLEVDTWLNEQQQAEVTDMVLELALPRVQGCFYYGWYQADFGARGYPVEAVLIRHFGGQPQAAPDDAETAADGPVPGAPTVVENG
ncbi:MAG: hypothetical protein ACYC1B_02115 [Thermoleophilia bacterium]